MNSSTDKLSLVEILHSVKSLIESHQANRIDPSQSWKAIQLVVGKAIERMGEYGEMVPVLSDVAKVMGMMATLLTQMTDKSETRDLIPDDRSAQVPPAEPAPLVDLADEVDPESDEGKPLKGKKSRSHWD